MSSRSVSVCLARRQITKAARSPSAVVGACSSMLIMRTLSTQEPSQKSSYTIVISDQKRMMCISQSTLLRNSYEATPQAGDGPATAEVVVEEIVIEEITSEPETSGTPQTEGAQVPFGKPADPEGAPEFSPEELEEQRNKELAERLRLFQQQAAVYYQQQMQMQQQQQQQNGEQPIEGNSDSANVDATESTAETTTDEPEPSTQPSASTPLSSQQDAAADGTKSERKFSRRMSYVTEADRHRAANGANTVHFAAEQKSSQTSGTATSDKSTSDDQKTASSTTSSAAPQQQQAATAQKVTEDVVVEPIHPDMVVWETFLERADGSTEYMNVIANGVFGVVRDGSDGSGGGDGAAKSKSAAEIIGGSHFADIGAVDPFSKGKVLNYVNRHKDQLPPTKNGKFFEIEEKEIKIGKSALASKTSTWAGAHSPLNNIFGDPDSVFIYRARLRVPLPPPHSSYIAEGMAESEKDAECLAAMHAERVIDTLGVPMYRLPSAQTKHAEAARKTGRKAPMPEDPIMPEGTALPMPLRMVSSHINDLILHKYGPADGCEATLAEGQPGAGKKDPQHFHEDFSLGGRVREAEVVIDSRKSSINSISDADATLKNIADLGITSRQMNAAKHAVAYSKERLDAAATDATTQQAQPHHVPLSPYSASGATSAFTPPPNEPPNPVDELYQTFHYPWRDGVNVDDTVDPNATPEQMFQREQAIKDQQLKMNASRMGFGNTASSTAKFDPTENNTFQVTNVVSVRFSPSDDSLQLAAIMDKKSVDRVKEWLQVTQGVFDIKSRLTASQVAVVGYAARMFVVELAIDPKDPTLVAKGKAVDKDVAIVLAAMHAELLIDATGRQLFPQNAARQARHASEVQGYGRWAVHPSRPNEKPPTDHLPLPLKQQVGVDEVWLDAGTSRSLRTAEERLLAAHNEIYNTVYDFIEVNPEPRSCKQAREIIKRWQREVARSRIDDLYVCTRMGDYIRASCVLPVPSQFGTRGGNAIGRSPEQAMDLCALHAIDVLCSLNIPAFRDPREQADFVAERKRQGLTVPNEEQGVLKPEIAGKRVFIPYVPGFLIEGDKLKLLPPTNDLGIVMGLAKNYESEFMLPTKQQANEKDIMDHGNDARLNVQMYCRRTANIVDQVPNIFITGFAKGLSVFNVAYLPLLIEKARCHTYDIRRSFPAPMTKGLEGLPDTNESKQFMRTVERVVGDPVDGYYRFLAVGASLKKADSIRMCFLHAADILANFGYDLAQEKNIFVNSKKSAKVLTRPAQPTVVVNRPAPPPAAAVAQQPPTLETHPPASTLRPIKPRRLQSVSTPPAGTATMSASAPPARPSRLQQLAMPTSNARSPATVNPPAQQTPPQPATPQTPLPAAVSSPPIQALPEVKAEVNQGATAQAQVADLPVRPTPVEVSPAYPELPIDTDNSVDHSVPPRLIPKPYYHPLMKTFFYNSKLERAAQRRQQNKTSVFGKR